MTKSNFMRIVLVIGSILILIGVFLTAWIMLNSDDNGTIKVNLDDPEAVSFESLALLPGESCEYVVELQNGRADKYTLTLDFVEKEEKTLKNFVRVKILSGNTEICDELLADLFLDDELTVPVDFTKDENTELKIVYYLPEEVGNEAKKAEAVFELIFTASNE